MGKRFDRVKIYKSPCLYREIEVNMKLSEALSEVMPVNISHTPSIGLMGTYSRDDFYRFLVYTQMCGINRTKDLIMNSDTINGSINKMMMYSCIHALDRASTAVGWTTRQLILNQIQLPKYANEIDNLLYHINSAPNHDITYGQSYTDHMIKSIMIDILNDISSNLKLGIKYEIKVDK